MTIPTAVEILEILKRATPRPTSEAPRDARGIYGLYDHTGAFRYIGSTSSSAETFYKRIHHRHRTGSESTSHYFSRMYNTGRMWRQRNDPATKTDGDIAKSVRNEFIARHCGCTWVSLPDHADIAGLEAQVIALAPPEMVAWNGRGMAEYDEPVDLVDTLIAELRLSPVERAALTRQRDRFHGGVPATKSAVSQSAGGVPSLPDGPFRFFALDVETANHDRASICQVGVACVRPDDSIETWVTLVNPQTETWRFTYLHGINAEMTRGAPTIGEVLTMLEGLLSGRTVYQHSGFDRSAIRAACVGLGRSEPDWIWKDSVGIARTAWPELNGNGGHGLASLKQHLGLRFEHHDAGEDARAAAQVVLFAEKGVKGTAKPRSTTEEDALLDDADIGTIAPSHSEASGAPRHHADTDRQRNKSLLQRLGSALFGEEKPAVMPNMVPSMHSDTVRQVPPSVSATPTANTICVPVAGDGSTFGPELVRKGRYTVGAKGAEEQYDSFDAALAALRQMDTPRWRRPNAAGNWGIVTGRNWTQIEKA
ncbi:3'-5' exonuclease [Donghicola eburneus]|uniref:3'-5' exonuclease n=1 Tax=Donghicola eburneus TaxID=393278 RepID=UPI0008ED9174|nr:3'-5' exonuclease [Donghicola eburneus]SFQ78273.1 DNA polymerase III, epsilon subunit [Donghicola eburneus]